MSKDRQQVTAILGGNATAFTTLVKDNERLVGQIVFRLIKNETEREDLCQEVFMRVYQNLKRFQFNAKLSTWIARISYNTCLNFIEKKKTPLYEDLASAGETIDSHPSTELSPAERTSSRQAATRLCEEIDLLPPVYGTIVSLYHLQEMSYAEIGQIMSLPDGTVKSYLFRARKMLKEKMLGKFQREELCA